MTGAPSFYRFIGQSFFTEVVELLRKGKHLALIGPRNGGKALVLAEVNQLLARMRDEARPEIVAVTYRGLGRGGSQEFCAKLAVDLGVRTPSKKRMQGARLAGAIVDLLVAAVERRDRPLWVFVQDVLGFSTPIARELLTAFQECHESVNLRRKLGVVVTGSSDFLDLTASDDSPYRHAEKMLVVGLEKEFGKVFFQRRRRQQRGEDPYAAEPSEIHEEIQTDAFEYLFAETGGMPHLMHQVILSPELTFERSRRARRGVSWTLKQTQQHVKRYTDQLMPHDHFCRTAMREAESSDPVFQTLCGILKKGDGQLRFMVEGPHPLETMGLARRSESGLTSISCPIWRRFLSGQLTPRSIADVYASHHRWHDAWSIYRELRPEQRDRPVSGDARYRLRTVLIDWADSLIESAQLGVAAVSEQFFLGATYLLGFDEIALFKKGADPPEILSEGPLSVVAKRPLVRPRGATLIKKEDDGVEYWLDNVRLSLWSDSKRELRSAPGAIPALLLARHGEGREIGTADQRMLFRALRRFWHALYIADDKEYREGIRERHLRAIEDVNQLLLAEPFDLARVVRGAAECLVRIRKSISFTTEVSCGDGSCSSIRREICWASD
jgi:hypothetical protein